MVYEKPEIKTYLQEQKDYNAKAPIYSYWNNVLQLQKISKRDGFWGYGQNDQIKEDVRKLNRKDFSNVPTELKDAIKKGSVTNYSSPTQDTLGQKYLNETLNHALNYGSTEQQNKSSQMYGYNDYKDLVNQSQEQVKLYSEEPKLMSIPKDNYSLMSYDNYGNNTDYNGNGNNLSNWNNNTNNNNQTQKVMLGNKGFYKETGKIMFQGAIVTPAKSFVKTGLRAIDTAGDIGNYGYAKATGQEYTGNELVPSEYLKEKGWLKNDKGEELYESVGYSYRQDGESANQYALRVLGETAPALMVTGGSALSKYPLKWVGSKIIRALPTTALTGISMYDMYKFGTDPSAENAGALGTDLAFLGGAKVIERTNYNLQRAKAYNEALAELTTKHGNNSPEVKNFKDTWNRAFEELKRNKNTEKEWDSQFVDAIKDKPEAIKITNDITRKYANKLKLIGTTGITPQTTLSQPPRKTSGDIDFSQGNKEYITELYTALKNAGYDVKLSKSKFHGNDKWHINMDGKEFVNMAENSNDVTYGQIAKHMNFFDVTKNAWAKDTHGIKMLNIRDQMRAKEWAGYIEKSRAKDIVDVKGIKKGTDELVPTSSKAELSPTSRANALQGEENIKLPKGKEIELDIEKAELINSLKSKLNNLQPKERINAEKQIQQSENELIKEYGAVKEQKFNEKLGAFEEETLRAPKPEEIKYYKNSNELYNPEYPFNPTGRGNYYTNYDSYDKNYPTEYKTNPKETTYPTTYDGTPTIYPTGTDYPNENPTPTEYPNEYTGDYTGNYNGNYKGTYTPRTNMYMSPTAKRMLPASKSRMSIVPESKYKETAFRPVIVNDDGSLIIGDNFKNKAQAINEGAIATDELPSKKFYIEIVNENPKDIKTGREYKNWNRFTESNGVHYEKRQYWNNRPRESNFNWMGILSKA